MKTNKFNLLAVALFFIFNSAHSQIWHFGSTAGIDFSGGSPVSINGGMTVTQEGIAAQYDCNGDLVFYSDGVNVWNSAHTAFSGGPLSGTSSMAQVLTCPKPGTNGVEYFIFYGAPGGAGFGATIRYAVLDATTSTITVKDLNLPTVGGAIFFEGMSLVAHSNGTDYWLVTHRGNSSRFDMYLIDGVSGADGIAWNRNENFGTAMAYGSSSIGYMATSKNNDRIAYANSMSGRIEVFDFDNTNADITLMPRTWNAGAGAWTYGVEFSPNGLYVFIGVISGGLQGLIQGNISTAVTIFLDTKRIGAVRRGPDDKIYTATIWESDLGVVNNPDLWGAAAGWDPTAIGGAGLGANQVQDGLPTISISPICVALSIELVSFTANENKGMVDLNWEVAAEENNDFYTIERSKNGLHWEELGRQSGMGTTTQSTEYVYSDENPYSGTSYYRLKQTDFNGKSKAFKMETVHFNQYAEVFLLKADQENVEIKVSVEKDDNGMVEIYNVLGERVVRSFQSLEKGSGRYQISIPANLSEGVYLLKIKTDSGFVKTLKFKL